MRLRMIATAAVIAVYFAVSAILVVEIVRAALQASLAQGFRDIFGNRWATAAFLDLLLSFSFTTTYIFARASPSVPCRPPRPPRTHAWLLSALVWTIGNPITLAYTSTLLLRADGDVGRAMCPISDDAEDDLEIAAATARDAPETQSPGRAAAVVGAVWVVAGLAFLGVCAAAAVEESFGAGLAYAVEHRWVLVTWVDVLVGLLFMGTFVVGREMGGMKGRGWVRAAAWLAGLAVLGNGATAIYCGVVALEAWKAGVSFQRMLLSPAGPSSVVSVKY